MSSIQGQTKSRLRFHDSARIWPKVSGKQPAHTFPLAAPCAFSLMPCGVTARISPPNNLDVGMFPLRFFSHRFSSRLHFDRPARCFRHLLRARAVAKDAPDVPAKVAIWPRIAPGQGMRYYEGSQDHELFRDGGK